MATTLLSSHDRGNGNPALSTPRQAYRKLRNLLGRDENEEVSRKSLLSDRSSEVEDQTMTKKTLYEDLFKQDVIRLIKLDPESSLSPLGYTVRAFALAKAPKYHALSYCWGSPDRTSSIDCNGFHLFISTHLKQGLAELASVPELTGKWFWIDQICVNQDDPAERSHQVILMRQIYTRTQQTVIWLGPAGQGGYAAGFDLAKDIYGMCQSNPTTHKRIGMRAKFPPKNFLKSVDEVPLLGLPRMSTDVGDDTPWAELAVLLGKPWFARMWILQEAVLAKKTPMLVFAHQARSWMHVIVAGAWVGQTGPAVRKALGLDNQQINCILFLASIWLTQNKWAIAALLRLTLHNQASDPRDRVFALLNLSDEGRFPDRVHDLLKPDYAKPLQHVYRDAVTVTITKKWARLLPLQLVNYRPGVSQGPSWVPDFHHAVPFINAISIDHSNSGATSYRYENDADYEGPQRIPSARQILFWIDQTARYIRKQKALELWCDPHTTDREFAMSSFPSHWERGYSLYQGLMADLEPFRFPPGKMVLTDEGKVGIVPEQVETSDEIVVFPKADAPFVVRPWPGQSSHALLGECCVDGWMKREAYDGVKNGTLQYRDFQLE
ncbi:HET-domain-containing protein [Thozetella sp. PMI_491]|nr:HET-domain-containing protein [Thozetella sp. PMI_491]